MEQRLILSLTQQIIQNIHQMKPLSEQVSSIQKGNQAQYLGREIHNKNFQMKEQLDSKKE